MRAGPTREAKRGTVEIAILACLERGDNYGLGILDELLLRSDGALVLKTGSLYPALHRMVRQGWLSARWELNEAGGSPRKYYRLTAAGRQVLDKKREEWRQVSDAMEAFMLKGSAAL